MLIIFRAPSYSTVTAYFCYITSNLVTSTFLLLQVKVDMGEPVLKASDVPTKIPPNKGESVVKAKIEVDGVSWNVTCVSMGNPHCVTFGREGDENLVVNELNLADIGRAFEHHVLFPARTNTEFVQVFSRTHLKMRVWEHGAGATLAFELERVH